MGSPSTQAQRASWEGPQTTVTISHCFKMAKTEVTQGQYKSVMVTLPAYSASYSNDPSYFSGYSTRPVEEVSWTDAMTFCQQLTSLERKAGYLPTNWSYRLPTEAEWEYACRAGTNTAFAYGPAMYSGMANFDGSYEYDSAIGEIKNTNGVHLWRTTAVASYMPNAFGLYDMHGNVWEWCLDYWQFNLPGGTIVNPRGPSTGTTRATRGGCWYNSAKSCRSAYRLPSDPGYMSNDIGFRVVLVRE